MAPKRRFFDKFHKNRASALDPDEAPETTLTLSHLSYFLPSANGDEITDAPTTTSEKEINSDSVDEVDLNAHLYVITGRKYRKHKDIIIERLSALHPSSGVDGLALFEQKVNQCFAMCDFTDMDVDICAKQVKSGILNEIQGYIETSYKTIPPHVLALVLKMIKAHIIRDMPPIDPMYLIYDDEPYFMENSWSHLAIVYNILFTIQNQGYPFKLDFALQIVRTFRAPSVVERENLLAFTKTYLANNPNDNKAIFDECAKLVALYLAGEEPPFAMTPILKLFSSSFEADTSTELASQVYWNTIVPLCKAPHAATIYPLLKEIFGFFMDKDPSLAVPTIKTVVKLFPQSKTSHQMHFLKLLTFLLEQVSEDDFEKIVDPVFELHANCIRSPHKRVADIAFGVWGNVNLIPRLIDNSHLILPIILPPALAVMKRHWSNQTRNAALTCLKSMSDLVPVEYDGVYSQYKQMKEVPLNCPHQEDDEAAQRKWIGIARSAWKNDQKIDLQTVLATIKTSLV